VTGVRVAVPAKINLSLRVGPLRPDGFHDLATIFQAVSLIDEVTVAHGEPDSGRLVTVRGPRIDGVPLDDRNLAARAAIAVAQLAGLDDPDVRIEIDKSIPVAGGMAGGSADAAATLLACRRLWEVDVDDAVLHRLAAELGSDVPFCLLGGTARGTGRGEHLVPVLDGGQWHWVVAFDEGELSTPEVFAECDRLRAIGAVEPTLGSDDELIAALRSGSPQELAPLLVNDLQPAALALRPSLAATLELGTELGALAGIVSGSGPTCVFLGADRDHAIGLAAELAGTGRVRGVRHAVGPVRGAHLVA
jgi:4-diphosphocytidyl-2-C-methyl-D-erythritol kinase